MQRPCCAELDHQREQGESASRAARLHKKKNEIKNEINNGGAAGQPRLVSLVLPVVLGKSIHYTITLSLDVLVVSVEPYTAPAIVESTVNVVVRTS